MTDYPGSYPRTRASLVLRYQHHMRADGHGEGYMQVWVDFVAKRLSGKHDKPMSLGPTMNVHHPMGKAMRDLGYTTDEKGRGPSWQELMRLP